MGVEIFSQRVKQLREEKNLTTRMLGEALGLSHAAISLYENSKHEPTLSVIKAYAVYFDVSLDYLLGVSDDRRR